MKVVIEIETYANPLLEIEGLVLTLMDEVRRFDRNATAVLKVVREDLINEY